jgi:hypothetical protein
VKIYIAANGGAQEKGKTGWTSVYSTKIGGTTSLGPGYFGLL